MSHSITHPHGLHIVIPTTESRVPTANVTKDETPLDTPGHSHTLDTPHVLDTPGHGHGLSIARMSPAPFEEDSAGHGHGLFRVPPNDVPTPTKPKPSARVARRSSLFQSTDVQFDEPQHVEHSFTETQHLDLPPTSEAEEPSTAEFDGSFENGASKESHEEANEHIASNA